MDILKKLEDKEAKVGLNRQDVADKKRNKQFIREYRIWKNKQGILPYSSNSDTSANQNKRNTKKPENIVRGGTNTKGQQPISTANKTPKQLQQLFQTNKRKLLEEIKRRTNPDGPSRRLSTSGKKRLVLIKEKIGIADEEEARTLARIPKEKLEILFTLSADYKLKTGKSILDKNNDEEDKAKIRKLRRSTYRSSVKYLKKFEEHDLETLTEREKALLRICLRRKRRIDEEQGTPLTPTRFDYLLTEVVDLCETKEDDKSVEGNTEENQKNTTTTDSANEKTNIENEENADVRAENENQGENNDNDDLTKEQNDEVENDVEIIEEQNDDNDEPTEDQNDNKNEEE